jgi:GNAT superfamily N-acetyltransferase
MEQILVRLGAEKDATALRDVRRSATETLSRLYRPRPGVILEEPNPLNAIVVAEVSGQLVAQCEYSIYNERLNFASLGVLESHRNRGVFRAVFVFLETIARQKNCKSIHCATIDITGNTRIFERLGMKMESHHESPFFMSPNGDSVIEIRLSKRL